MKFCISVKKTVCIIISMLCVLYVTGAAGIAAFADEDDLLSDTDARAALVTELESGSVICAHGENEKLSMGHMAKLMTLLICAERLRSGELSFERQKHRGIVCRCKRNGNESIVKAVSVCEKNIL